MVGRATPNSPTYLLDFTIFSRSWAMFTRWKKKHQVLLLYIKFPCHKVAQHKESYIIFFNFNHTLYMHFGYSWKTLQKSLLICWQPILTGLSWLVPLSAFRHKSKGWLTWFMLNMFTADDKFFAFLFSIHSLTCVYLMWVHSLKFRFFGVEIQFK